MEIPDTGRVGQGDEGDILSKNDTQGSIQCYFAFTRSADSTVKTASCSSVREGVNRLGLYGGWYITLVIAVRLARRHDLHGRLELRCHLILGMRRHI